MEMKTEHHFTGQSCGWKVRGKAEKNFKKAAGVVLWFRNPAWPTHKGRRPASQIAGGLRSPPSLSQCWCHSSGLNGCGGGLFPGDLSLSAPTRDVSGVAEAWEFPIFYFQFSNGKQKGWEHSRVINLGELRFYSNKRWKMSFVLCLVTYWASVVKSHGSHQD